MSIGFADIEAAAQAIAGAVGGAAGARAPTHTARTPPPRVV